MTLKSQSIEQRKDNLHFIKLITSWTLLKRQATNTCKHTSDKGLVNQNAKRILRNQHEK
jgi:hypothetical protein